MDDCDSHSCKTMPDYKNIGITYLHHIQLWCEYVFLRFYPLRC